MPNTPNSIIKGDLFPAQLIPELFNSVKGKSSLAKLCGASPLPFNGFTEFVFSMDNEVNIVAEAGAKPVGGGSVGTVTVKPVKVEYGMRVSDEFMYAADEVAMDYLRAFAEGFARKMARGLDIMAMHGTNPRTGSASSLIGTNHLDSMAATTVSYKADSSTPDANIESAIAGIMGYEMEATGLIGGNTLRADLAAMTKANGDKLYPELKWGGQPERMNGLPCDFNTTVQVNSAAARCYVGDFANYFKWGIAKEIPMKVIEYGCPDGDTQAGDLQAHNQVYLRGEAYIGWGIMDGKAFGKIYQA